MKNPKANALGLKLISEVGGDTNFSFSTEFKVRRCSMVFFDWEQLGYENHEFWGFAAHV